MRIILAALNNLNLYHKTKDIVPCLLIKKKKKKHKIKDCKSKEIIYIIALKRNQIIERKLREKFEKYGGVKSVRARQDKHGREDIIGMAC